jgi:hypothetical protein
MQNELFSRIEAQYPRAELKDIKEKKRTIKKCFNLLDALI